MRMRPGRRHKSTTSGGPSQDVKMFPGFSNASVIDLIFYVMSSALAIQSISPRAILTAGPKRRSLAGFPGLTAVHIDWTLMHTSCGFREQRKIRYKQLPKVSWTKQA